MIETISCGSANIPIKADIDNENKNKDMGQGLHMTDNNEINRDTKSRRHEINMKLKRLIKLKREHRL